MTTAFGRRVRLSDNYSKDIVRIQYGTAAAHTTYLIISADAKPQLRQVSQCDKKKMLTKSCYIPLKLIMAFVETSEALERCWEADNWKNQS